MVETTKGFRVEIAGWEWVQYVVADSAAKAKFDIVRRAVAASGHPRSYVFGCIRSCRRFPALDGKEPGEYATYELRYGNERPLEFGRNRTAIHGEAQDA